ncbi:MAG: RNA 2',3'-cyclic phosphodiesterase, partial [Alphaproteobacteria bacterium HGW-Alphaproteobacteria-8]
MIRLFAALAPPDPICDRLEMVQQGLPGRLTPRENFHLTLAFFGEASEPQAADLHARLLALDGAAFDFWLDGVGAFGGTRPRLIHAIVRPEPALELLHQKTAQAGRDAGLRVEER